jgi:hypothetical protein
MSDNSTDDRTKSLLETVSELLDLPADSELNRLTADQRQSLFSTQGLGNTKALKESIKDILAGRAVTDAITGGERTNLGGSSNPGSNHGNQPMLSITDFSEEEVKEAFDALMARAALIESELKGLRNIIEDKVAATSTEITTISVNTRVDRNLRAAMKRVFGKKSETITFDMYKEVLELRNRFNKEEVAATTDGEISV